MTQEDPKKKLSEGELAQVAGGGSAIEQIQQAIDQTKDEPQNANSTLNMAPPSMSYPTSGPFNY